MSEDIIAAIEAPRTTYEIVGHEGPQGELARAWARGRFHHAWLFSGPRGIGKATLVWAAARHVLVHGADNGAGGRGDGGAPFGVGPDHPQSRLLAAGGHPDCRLVRRSFDMTASPPRFRGSISVNDVRVLGPFFHQTSTGGGWRVAVVDAADEMTVNAANALLKLLEEPPARTVLFLVAHAPQRLLPTIRSRCRKLDLHPLDEDRVIEVMTPHLGELHRDDLVLLARLGHGSPGRAIELANAGGAQTYRALMSVLATLPDLDEARALELADRFSGPRAGDDFITFIELLLGWLARMVHDVALARQWGGHQGVADADPTGEQGAVDHVETMLNLRLAHASGLDRWLEVWDKARALVARCRELNLDRHQVTMSIFFHLADAARAADRPI